MSDSTHFDVLKRVKARLEDLDLRGISRGSIYLDEFPFARQPPVGLAISEIQEDEGMGTNERDDFAYGVQLTRIFGGYGHGGYQEDRSFWRRMITKTFHRQLLGNIDCEIITKVVPSTIILPKEWRDWGIDSSVMQLWCWVRESRD